MSEAIIVAVITGLCAIGSQLASSAKLTKELYSKLDTQSQLSDERLRSEIALVKSDIAELRKTVEKHNNVVERVYRIEQDLAVQGEKLDVANNRIKDLETITAG